jgi:3-methyladenine DNA glycosylase AlkD
MTVAVAVATTEAQVVAEPAVIEAEMKDAPDRPQWAMNHCLARIGIDHPAHRGRAIAIGERLRVPEDHPTPPNRTSPFAPTWITEMVRRRQSATL